MNFQMTLVPDYREECQGEGFAEVLSGAKPLRAGPTAKWSRQQTRISPEAPMRIMGAGERTKWIGNEKSAARKMAADQYRPCVTPQCGPAHINSRIVADSKVIVVPIASGLRIGRHMVRGRFTVLMVGHREAWSS